MKCDYSIDEGGWRVCANDRSLTCDSPAVDFKATFQLYNHSIKYDVVCPWSATTATLGIASFVVAGAYLVVYILNPKVKSFGVMALLFILGLISVLILIATFVFMIIEIVDNEQVERHYDVPEIDYKSSQASYIINAVFVGVSFVVIILMTFFALRKHYKNGDQNEHENELLGSQASYEKPGFYNDL